MRQRQLNSLLDFLLLNIHTTNVGISNIRLLSHFHHLNGCIGVCWQNINDSLRRSMKGNSCIWLQVFSIQCRKNSNVILGTLRGSNDTVGLIDHLNKVTSSKMDRLDSFNLFLFKIWLRQIIEILTSSFDLTYSDLRCLCSSLR